MASKSADGASVEWLISKRFRVQRPDSKRRTSLFIGLGFPQKFKAREFDALGAGYQYGCLVQTGRSVTKHVVYGRDRFAALAHAVLAIEHFLRSVSEESAIYDLRGGRFDADVDLVVLGIIGHQYLKSKRRGKKG